MVFESIVADLLNRFLGDYVENLDRKQLKLGIWGGDVSLKNLDVKASALDDLDLPVQVICGHLGHLHLKIPWKNMYTSPVIATIEELYVIVNPNLAVRYDEEKEQKAVDQAKFAELQRIEDAKAKQAQKKNAKEDKKDTFTEKLVTQIIKNLQVKIIDIHIRYEDTVTDRKNPFSFGFTLHNLSFETTDEKWVPTIIQENVRIIHKLVTLDSVSLYWNCNTTLLTNMSPEERTAELKKAIATSSYRPSHVSYMLGPIYSTAQLRLNSKPEIDDFKVPKVWLNVAMDEIAVGLAKHQYRDLMKLLEAFDRLTVATLYRKYRPHVPHEGHPKEWWNFAITVVLEEVVRRKRRNWSWQHMHGHRECCKRYKELYVLKLLGKKLSSEQLKGICDCEKQLDLFNITVARKQAELEAQEKRQKHLRKAKTIDTKGQSWGGWVGSWFSSGATQSSQDDESAGKKIIKQFEEAMTDEEKAKLYEAIGYQDQPVIAEYPKEFVENKLIFVLHNLTVTLSDNTKSESQVLRANLQDVSATVDQRTSAQGMSLEAKIDSFVVQGIPSSAHVLPTMVTSQGSTQAHLSLLTVWFEMNPLDGTCDNRLHVQAQPLEIIFDALTVNSLVEVFTPPEQVDLHQLQQTAMIKLQEMKEMSAFGLQYAIEQHKYLDLKVDMKPAFIIVPEKGEYSESVNLIVMSLGNFKMDSAKRDPNSPTVRSMVKAGSTEEEVMSTMMENAYDKYQIRIENAEIILASPGDDWRKAVGSADPSNPEVSSLHLLQPVSLSVDLHKSIITVDPRMPIIRLTAELTSLNISISDDQLLNLVKLGNSIPTPQVEHPPPVTKKSNESLLKSTGTVDAKLMNQAKKEAVETFKSASSDTDEFDSAVDAVSIQKTDFELKFEVKQFGVCLSYNAKKGQRSMVKVSFNRFGTLLTMRTFDMSCDVYLGGILFEDDAYLTSDNLPIKLVSTSMNESSENLLTLKYLQANKKGPDFETVYNSTLQFVAVDIRDITVVLHQEAIISLMEFFNSLVETVGELGKDYETQSTTLSTIQEEGTKLSEQGKSVIKRKKKDTKIIDMEIRASLDSICVAVCSIRHNLTDIKIKGMSASVVMDKLKTSVSASLKDMIVIDPGENALYPMILSTDAGEVLDVKLNLFNDATDDENYIDLYAVDMNVSVSFGQIKIVFLNKFVASILCFLDHFQTAKQKVVEASAVAAEAAKQGMEKVYEKATRIALDICIQAPVIIIPQNSSSKNTILVDLGILKMSNKFKFGNRRNELGIPAILDRIVMNLENLQLSRGLVNPKANEIVAECALLEPISFSVIVVRNLASSWYTDEPEVDVFGKLEAICVSLSQEDYTTVMRILSENLAETQVQSKGSLVSQPSIISHEDKVQKRQSVATVEKVGSKSSSTQPSIKMRVFTRFKLNFELDKVSMKFYLGATELTKSKNLHDPSQSMAEVQAQMLTVRAQMMSDDTMTANVLLENATLTDTRVSRKGITRLMDRIYKDDSEKMITVSFHQASDGEKKLDVKVCSFSLIASLPYILKLAEFFSQTSDQSTPQAEKPLSELKATESASSAQVTSEYTPKGQTIITIKIESPDIVLIEDIDDVESNAIFLNNEITAKIGMSDETISISGQITDLTFYTASFNSMKRESTTVHILNPSRIDLQCNFKPLSKTIDLLVHDLVLQISPGTVQLITNILSALVTEKVPDAPVQEKVIHDYVDLWKPKPLSTCNYWFLQKMTGSEKAVEAVEEATELDMELAVERMLFTLKKVILTIEAGRGRRTVPMLLMETSFQAQICDWSSELNIESTLGIEVSCYNEKIAVWEPLLEPVETVKGHRSWELYMEICKRTILLEEEEELESLPASLKVEVRSDDVLELTISKTCMETLTNLSEAFGAAVKPAAAVKDKHPYSPYRVYNELGIPITLIVEGMFQVLGANEEYGTVLLNTSCSPVHLTQILEKDLRVSATIQRISMLKKQFTRDATALNIKIAAEDMNIERTISVACINKRYFQLPRTTYPGEKWGFVVDIKSDAGCRIITFQSNVQVHNYFSIPMDIYYMNSTDNEALWCGTVDPHKVLHLPLHAVYTKSSELFFKPQEHHQMYTLCSEPFLWKNLLENPRARKILQCNCKFSDMHSFFIDAAGTVEHIFFEETTKKTVASSLYTINLYPTVRLRNFLFYPIHFSLQGVDKDFELKCGESEELWSAETGKTGIEIRINKYLDRDWVCYRTLSTSIEELSVWTFSAILANSTLSMELGMRTQHVDGSLVMELYSPYCMINKTGLMLVYRRSKKGEKVEGKERKLSDVSEFDEDERQSSPSFKSDEESNSICHPPELDQPVMFSFKAKAFFSKKKVAIKVKDSEWTEKFSIDAVGSSGNVIAKTKSGQHYDVGVQIKLSHSSLTKMIIFTPFYILVNNCQFDIEVQEVAESADWIKVEKDECAAFWPINSSTAQMVVRYVDDASTSEAFSYKDNQNTLLQLQSNRGGIQVECMVAQSSIMLTFEDYIPGHASALLVNHMAEYMITYCQMGSKLELQLPPYTCVLYSWENPLGKRILTWKCQDKKDGTHDLIRDGVGDFQPENDVKAYWLSFLDGMQRVVIFTHDLNRAVAVESACQEIKMEQEFLVMLQGVGLSLVNNDTKLEIMYMGITSTGVIWEGKKEKRARFKPLSLRECMVLETGYMRHQNELKIGKKIHGASVLDSKIEVDFQEMKMLKPVVKNIRRSFQTGLWFEYKASQSASYFHAKINRLQIDNQLADCVFPVVFTPIPPPKSVAAESAPKPFTELSVMLQREAESNVMKIKYCKILIQEFHVKLDQSFINSMIQFFTPDEPTEVDYVKLMILDKDIADSSLKAVAAVYSSQEQKCYYENLHLSPLKVHISFSNTGAASGDDKKPTAIHSDFLNLLLQSIGVTLTEIQDVIFKLDFFERKYVFMSTKQLINEASGHYTSQAVKQLYMLVLGLDVIGNPVGLILGLGEGVTDLFYEPFQGAIQGPEEFFEGLGLGVKSLFGHAIGGAAGAASRITGTLGKGLAALTMDDDYQRKRRQYLNRRPQEPGQRFAQGGKSLVIGVYEGVTGVVSKPMEGAREGGVGGFFKGVGKGLIGIITRPTAGAADFVTGSFDSVKKLAELHDEVKRLRPPRYIRSDGVIRPYVKKESEGSRLLQDVEKGKYSSTDIYEAHIAVGVDEKSFLLVTNNRLMYVTKGEVFGQWNTEWEYRWDQLKAVPTVTESGIKILLKEPHRKKMNMFGSKVAGKLVHAHDLEQCKLVVAKIQDIMERSS